MNAMHVPIHRRGPRPRPDVSDLLSTVIVTMFVLVVAVALIHDIGLVMLLIAVGLLFTVTAIVVVQVERLLDDSGDDDG